MKDDKDGNNAFKGSAKGSAGDTARCEPEASEARYRAIVEDQTEMICRFLPGGKLTFVNEAYCRCFGKKREELIGKSFMTLIPETDHDLFNKHLASLGRENPVSVVEHRVILPGGEVHWQQWTDRAIFDGRGRLVEFQSVGRDVTERRRAEEELTKYRRHLEEMVQERTNELRAANERLHNEIAERGRAEESLRRAYGQLTDIVEFLPDATFVIDLDKKVIAWNRAIEEMTGVRKEDILGRGDYAYSVPFYGDPRPILIDLVISGDSEIETKYGYIERKACKIFGEIYTPGVYRGRGAFLWGTASPLYDGAGNKVGAIESIRDITELHQAKEEAEAASRAKGEFLMNMSHEIRTPMNAITGMTELLLDTSLSEEQRDYATTIYESSQLLLTILDDILDLSKIEAKKLSLEEIDFEPAPLIEGVTKLMAVKASEKNLSLQTFIDSGVPPLLRGDTVRLRQVLFNLVGNAVKFTEYGGVTLRAGMVSKGKEHVVLRFEVSDTGIGISREGCGRIFQAFSQVNGTVARKFGGTGLGLAISSQLVKLMGGEIGVESEKGKGSTFWFAVPFKHPMGGKCLSSVETEPAPLPLSSGAPALNKEGLILLVEDNPVNQKVTLAQLKKLGYPARAVSNGREAVEAALGGRYALILMDCQMSVMDGYQAARVIRKAESFQKRHTPIVALTAVVDEDGRKKCISAGMDDFLGKPVSLEQLRAALARCLQQQGGEAVEGTPPAQPAPGVIDMSVLEELRRLQAGAAPDLLGNLIGVYLRDATLRINAMREAIIQKDPAALVFPAHNLKSSSANVGALGLAAVCEELETMGRAGAIEGVAEKVAQVEIMYEKVRLALKSACRKGGSASE